MTKTDQARRRWLGSLKAGDEVAIVTEIGPRSLATVERRTSKRIIIGSVAYSARTGVAFGPNWAVLPRIEPITSEIRDKVERKRAYRAVESRLHHGVPASVLHLFELILDWQHSPDVILAATERILEVTKERTEAQR